MARLLRRLGLAAVVAAAGFLCWRHLGSRPLPVLEPAEQPPLFGSFHVHSASSHDSTTPLETIAATAKEHGLAFVVVTDHNEQLAGPVSIGGVTLISYAELSTPYGHLIQLGAGYVLPPERRAAPDVLDAVRELGGVPILAHPTDRKRPWDGPVPGAGGLEIANLAASARRLFAPPFVGGLPALAVSRSHPRLAIAQAYDRDDAALRLWDQSPDPRFVGLCGTDAHGRILNLATNLTAWELAIDAALPDALEERSAALLEYLAAGRFYCVASAFGRPRFDFAAKKLDGTAARAGDTAQAADVEELVILGPVGEAATLVLLRNGEPIVRSRGDELRYAAPGPGTYRVEVHVPLPGVLWGERSTPIIYSNRIRIAGSTEVAAP
jgi:hypothetical protein